jgi:hypothetical protein
MGVLVNDPFYQTPATVLSLTHREVWDWIVEGPFEQARKDAGKPTVEELNDAEATAATVAKLFGADAEVVAAAIRESEGK